MATKFEKDQIRERVGRAAMRAVVRGTESIRNEAINLILSTAKSGRVYQRRGIVHYASAPGEPPASDTGNLVRSITTQYDRSTLTGKVIVTAAYGPYLEFGTAKMAPRPFLRPAVANRRDAIEADIAAEIEKALSG